MTSREFIGEAIEIILPPGEWPVRNPPAPAGFHWRERDYRVEAVLEQWWDYDRVTPARRTYGSSFQRTVGRRGSYGIGRCHFLVRAEGETFLLYYDRRPTATSPGGSWVLLHRLRP